MVSSPWALKTESQLEAYRYFDKHIRVLKKSSDGTIDQTTSGLQDNDIDAFRHAYVSAVFTQEYGESAADIFGRLNEFLTADLYSNSRDPRSLNMDLWNNRVGRAIGKGAKTRGELLRKVHASLKNGELMISLTDPREFDGARNNPEPGSKYVIVLDENRNGLNESFFDLRNRTLLSRQEFVSQIESGQHPGYYLKKIGALLVPSTKPDTKEQNNLG